MTKKRKRYTNEFKLEVIALVIEHKRAVADVAISFAVGKSKLQKWLSHYRKKEQRGITPKTGNALTEEQHEIQ